jgi:hypothetical protein
MSVYSTAASASKILGQWEESEVWTGLKKCLAVARKRGSKRSCRDDVAAWTLCVGSLGPLVAFRGQIEMLDWRGWSWDGVGFYSWSLFICMMLLLLDFIRCIHSA